MNRREFIGNSSKASLALGLMTQLSTKGWPVAESTPGAQGDQSASAMAEESSTLLGTALQRIALSAKEAIFAISSVETKSGGRLCLMS